TPAIPGQQLNATLIAQTQLSTPEEFGRIMLKVTPDGAKVTLQDVADISLGAENYAIEGRYNGQASSGLAINLATGANALETSNLVRERIAELEEFFPPGLKVEFPYDTTPFVKISITEV